MYHDTGMTVNKLQSIFPIMLRNDEKTTINNTSGCLPNTNSQGNSQGKKIF